MMSVLRCMPVNEGADVQLQQKLEKSVGGNAHFQGSGSGFVIHHYAGVVSYDVDGFCERNRDVLFTDIIQLMQTSDNPFIVNLFPENVSSTIRTRPTTAGSKIRTQANKLVEALTKCTPHYIRCIKPNASKKAHDWDEPRVKHQVEYLGLKENIRVRRAGFAYRRPFDKFLLRYSILTKETWPSWQGDIRKGVMHILNHADLEKDEYQLGTTKLFIKAPESLFLLEERRERMYDSYARVIQKAFRRYVARRHYMKLKTQAADLLYGKKERRRYSINRNFIGDYIGLDEFPAIRVLVGKREHIEFAGTVKKFDRRFKITKRDLVLTQKCLYLIGREKVKKGPEKGLVKEVIKRKIELENINQISVSTHQDDLLVIQVKNDYDSLLECMFKTELLTVLDKTFHKRFEKALPLSFSDSMQFRVKKEGFVGGGMKQVKVSTGQGDLTVMRPSGNILLVYIGPGLAKDTRPGLRQSVDHNLNQFKSSTRGLRDVQPPKSTYQHLRRAPPPPNFPPPPVPEEERTSSTHVPSTGAKGKVRSTNIRHNSNTVPFLPEGFTQQIAHRLNQAVISRQTSASKENQCVQQVLPDAGISKIKRQSMRENKPLPGGGKPKPPTKPKPALPQCRTLYAYDAQDTDELSFEAGVLIGIVKQDPSGWWLGKLKGKEGLFPGNYVEVL
ncbi:unconventional myosin-Ie-like [Tachypleus tridentatus]|uniref:unconventional myosin-Ie-like n=2 Tax=Tachypleus tridentatus TaxID=6853 RepID=UPI003FD3D128